MFKLNIPITFFLIEIGKFHCMIMLRTVL